MKTVNISANVEIPGLPNYLRMIDGKTLAISALTDESLKMIGEEWTKSLIEKAQRQREGNAQLVKD